MIRDAIEKELARGGQVYVLYNLSLIHILWSVLGIGVAERVRTSTLVLSCLSFSLCFTPNRCSSSITKSPMDRLLCGDVGFGKTEVAARALFKCVADGKQAAVLVPTTLLALSLIHI